MPFFLTPCISIFIFGLFLLIPKIDPLKKNIEKFRSYYEWFIVLMIAFLAYIYFATLAWALGYRFSMNAAILPPIAALFYFVGVLCENSKRNWFIGVRTPWTLSSDRVWGRTNKLAGIILAAIYLVVYSYFEYQKEIKK